MQAATTLSRMHLACTQHLKGLCTYPCAPILVAETDRSHSAWFLMVLRRLRINLQER